MGDQNSSMMQVQPVFNELLDRWPDGDPWLGELWDMAALTRPGVAPSRPTDVGTLLPSEAPRERAARVGAVYERTIAPPAAFLRWLLENPRKMHLRDADTFGAKSDDARRWRGKLFSGDTHLVAEAQAEGLKQLGKRLAQRGRNKWWAFEGFSRVDCCLETGECLLLVEGTGAAAATPSTLWFPERSRLWRNVEAAAEIAGGKPFAVVLAVDNEAAGTAALADAERSLAASYPHLEAAQRADLSRHLLGFVTWPEVITRFSLPPECLAGTERK